MDIKSSVKKRNMLVIILLILMLESLPCSADTILEVPKPHIYLDFDSEVKSNKKSKLVYGNDSAKKFVEGIKGAGLLLADNCLTINLEKHVGRGEGTIMFWLKPQWDYYENINGDLISHTFASMKWNDGGYFVLSDGWWEKTGGSHFTYFIYDNEEYVHTHSKIIYEKNRWSHLAVTWNSSDGIISLYHNGELVSTKSKEFTSEHYAEKILIGCDYATSLYSKRWMNGVIDDIKIFEEELDLNQINASLGISETEMMKIKYHILDDSRVIENVKVKEVENRIVFDSYPASWQTKEQAKKTMQRLHDAGINVYVPCVWYGDGARFDSKIAPAATYKGRGKPLEYLIKVAHEYGIEVHPWVTVTYRSKEFLHEYFENGTPPNAFEVHNKEFRDFMVEFITDLVKRYDVDGINLDYIRTMGISKSKIATDLFNKKYNRSLLEEVKDIDSNHSWNTYVQEFVNEPIDDIVRRVSLNVRSIKPNAIISVDGHPMPLFLGESRQGRNDIKWLNEGVIDVIYSMNYGKSIDYRKIDLVMEDAIDPSKIIVLLGMFDRTNEAEVSRSAEMVKSLIEYSRYHWGNGVALYPLSTMSDEIFDSLRGDLFKNRAKVKWKH